MPWNWDGRGRKSVNEGGSVGTVQEAASARTWPTYNASYLASRLGGQRAKEAAEMDKYAAAGTMTNEAAQAVYLTKIAENYKEEADECLKSEFSQWLQGKHDLNDATIAYPNDENAAQRRFVFRDQTHRNAHGGGVAQDPNDDLPGQKMDDWRPTWWGRGSLTHLPGVRDYLRSDAIPANDSELTLNMLAEFGPQNIDQAWMYFKHWVKGRPVSEATCLQKTAHATDNNFDPSRGHGPSQSFYNTLPPSAQDPYKWDMYDGTHPGSSAWEDHNPKPGRPPQAIPRFCVATEPCNPKNGDKSVPRTPPNTVASSRTATSSAVSVDFGNPPGISEDPPTTPGEGYMPFEEGEKSGRRTGEPVEGGIPLPGFGLNCAGLEMAEKAAEFFRKQDHFAEGQDRIEADLRYFLDKRNKTVDEGEREAAEQEFFDTVKKSMLLRQNIEEAQEELNATAGVSTELNNTINETVDSVGYELNSTLVNSLSVINGESLITYPAADSVSDALKSGSFVPDSTYRVGDLDALMTNTGYHGSLAFTAMYPMLLAVVASTGYKLKQLNNGIKSCSNFNLPPAYQSRANLQAKISYDLADLPFANTFMEPELV
jgi:hypothetical protein